MSIVPSPFPAPALDWSSASRLWTTHSRMASTPLLLGLGAMAAATALIEMKLQIPGNAILRSLLPYALGLAIVPRRGAGMTMTVGSAFGLAAMRAFGFQKGLGGMTSLMLLGPSFELALWQARPNWFLYLRFALAGLLANGAAFAVQVTARSYGIALGGGRDSSTWLSTATITYPLCGMVAGLVAGLLLFHWRPWRSSSGTGDGHAQGGSP